MQVLDDATVKILVDGQVPNEEYQKYPIQYDFYINNRLFSSQITSKQLPGPIGIDVSSEVVPLPFNYTIKATVLHPNRTFTTMAFGAVDESLQIITPTPVPLGTETPGTTTGTGGGTSILNCTVGYDSTGSDNVTDYINDSVTISESGSLVSASFNATADDGTSSIKVDFAVTSSGSAGSTESRPLTGTVQVTSGNSIDTIEIEGEVAYLKEKTISDFTVGDLDAKKLDIFCGDTNSSAARRLADRTR